MNYGFTRPNVISEGAYRQHTGQIDPAAKAQAAEMAPENGVIITDPNALMNNGAVNPNLFQNGAANGSLLNTAPPQIQYEAVPAPAPSNRQTSNLSPAGTVPEEKTSRTFLALNK